MKNAATRASIALAMLTLATALLPCGAQGQAAEVLSNESVVQMVTGKVPKSLILTKIQGTPTAFDLTPKGLVGLFTSKVPNDVIKLMMKVGTSADSKEVLANDGVIFMTTSQLPRDIIILKVQSTKPGFDLTTGGLVNLNENKVHQDVMKAMMSPRYEPPPSTPPQVIPASQSAGAPAPASKLRKLTDGEPAVIKTSLSKADATAKVKAYFTSRKLEYTVNQETGALVSSWYGERDCSLGTSRCANRANVRVAPEEGQMVVRVQVFERKRGAGTPPKPWTDNSTNKGKETGEFADALEAFLMK